MQEWMRPQFPGHVFAWNFQQIWLLTSLAPLPLLPFLSPFPFPFLSPLPFPFLLPAGGGGGNTKAGEPETDEDANPPDDGGDEEEADKTARAAEAPASRESGVNNFVW